MAHHTTTTHAYAQARLVWDGLLLLLMAYYCVMVPLRIPFGEDSWNALLVVDLVLTAIFLIDVLLNFHTGTCASCWWSSSRV